MTPDYIYHARPNVRTGLWEVIETRDSGNRPFFILKSSLTQAKAEKLIAAIEAANGKPDWKTLLA